MWWEALAPGTEATPLCDVGAVWSEQLTWIH